MKRIALLFIAIIACLITAAAQIDTSAVQPSVTDTQIEYTDTPDTESRHTEIGNKDRGKAYNIGHAIGSDDIVSIIAIIAVFGLPAVIVFIAFYFKYKNRRAKYKLVEQALAAGQPIPEDLFHSKAQTHTLQKGITNAFTGVGLFIFLWAITGKFSIGCIGVLIMFMGLGQIAIHYTQNGKDKKEKNQHNNDNTNTPIQE